MVSETYAVVPTLAAAKIAWQARPTVAGSCMPPFSKSAVALRNPAAMYASSASCTSGIRWTRCPSKVGSCSSALRLCGANFSSAIASAVSIAASIVSRECCAKRGRSRSESMSSASKSWNSRSRRLTIRERMARPRAGRFVRSVEQQLHLERDVVGATLRRGRRIRELDALVLEGEVEEVGRCDVVLQAARNPHLVVGPLHHGRIHVADLPHLELAEDGELQVLVVVRALGKVVPLLEDVGIGPGEVGSARSSPHPAVIEANLQEADELVAAPGICTRERKVDEGGGAEAVVRVLGGPWRRWVLVAQDLVVEVAHHAE